MINAASAIRHAPIIKAQEPFEQSKSAAKNSVAPGQMAKAILAENSASGAELPKNTQGKLASGLARGVDPQTIFDALITLPEEPVEAVEDIVAVADEVSEGDDDSEVKFTTEPVFVSDHEAALSLLIEDGETSGAA